MDALTQTISLLFRHRQTGIERFGQGIDHIQHKQLHALLSMAHKTEWGLKYGCKGIRSYSNFYQRPSLQTHDEVKPCVTRMISGERNILWPSMARWYARNSGTTNNKSKFLPVTPEILKGYHYRGGFDCVATYLQDNSESHLFSKKGSVSDGSHSPFPLNFEAHQGDLSTVLLQNLSPLVNLIRIPKEPIVPADEQESKTKTIMKNTWDEDVNSLSGVPSWMLALIRTVLKKAGREYLTDVWPNLEVLSHGGISFEPYREQYKTLIPSNRMHHVRTYSASEDFFGLQGDPTDPSLLMTPDYGTFYEFISMNEVGNAHPTVLPLEPVEIGKNYTTVVMTLGGLRCYQIGDTVRFTSLFPHKLVISGRAKHSINASGEELMAGNADKVIVMTYLRTEAKVREYTAIPPFVLDKAKGRHQWFIELDKKPGPLDEFTILLDQNLQKLNSNYEAKRYEKISLQPLEIVTAHDSTFYKWPRQESKLGGQHKIPHLSNDRTHIEEPLHINQSL